MRFDATITKQAKSSSNCNMKKLFTNNIFFHVTAWMAAIGYLSHSIISVAMGWDSLSTKFICFLYVPCILCIYYSYKDHRKNVMKGMMGALLMAAMIDAFHINLMIGKASLPINQIAPRIYLLLIVILFINHFLINGTRSASPRRILINQITCILLLINEVVYCIMWFRLDSSPIRMLANVLNLLETVSFYSFFVCVESRLDAYRLDREAAGWTEEAGYPEGYVHEYEKKQQLRSSRNR